MDAVETDAAPQTADPTRRARLVRRVVLVVSVAGIAGMIFGSIRDNNGIAITFGLVTAVAVGFLILLTAVVGRDAFVGGGHGDGPPRVDERVAADVEARVQRLVAEGADEHEVRQLVSRAVELGRG